MSRVGVRTLLIWYRAKPLCKPNNFSYTYAYRWKHSNNLNVYLYKDCYIINHQIDAYNTIELTQQSQDIDLTHAVYHGVGSFLQVNYKTATSNNTSKLAECLLTIPVTDIFTMFPAIVSMIKEVQN